MNRATRRALAEGYAVGLLVGVALILIIEAVRACSG